MLSSIYKLQHPEEGNFYYTIDVSGDLLTIKEYNGEEEVTHRISMHRDLIEPLIEALSKLEGE